MNRLDRPWLRAIAPLSLMVVIFILSAQPGGGDHPWWDIVLRKVGHVTGYALLTALWWWALSGVSRRPLLLAALISLAYGCTDEFHQTFVSDRTGTPVDVGIDAIGIALAALIIILRQVSPSYRGRRDAVAESP
jgi:VanZ family protein